MKLTKIIVALTVGICAIVANAALLPFVGDEVKPNVWTKNVSGVFEDAKRTGMPIFLVMVNSYSDGAGCSKCKTFINATIKSPGYAALVKKYKFYMVFLNEAVEYSHGYIDSEVYDDLWRKYFYSVGVTSYPFVAILDSEGTRRKYWEYPTTGASKLYEQIEDQLKKHCVFTTGFSMSSVSPSVVNVSTNVWKGKVVRTGTSGLTGSVSLSLSGDNASNYTVSPSSFTWDDADGEKQFTVSCAKEKQNNVIVDKLTLRIDAGGGFVGNKRVVEYGTREIGLEFRNEKINKTLSEFAKRFSGLSFSSQQIWYEPKSSVNTLEASIPKSILTVKANTAGIMELSAVNVKSAVLTNAEGSKTVDIGSVKKIGLGAGDKITVTAADSASSVTPSKLTKLTFVPVSVTLTSPINNAVVSYQEILQTKKMKFSWSASPANLADVTYKVSKPAADEKSISFNDAVYSGGEPRCEADASKITAGKYWWGVEASVSGGFDYGSVVARATGCFTVSAKPEFPDGVPVDVTAYLKGSSRFDFSAKKTDGAAVSYTAAGLPKGMTIDAATGIISGTPKKSGTYTVTVTAVNEFGTAQKTVKIATAKFPSEFKGKYGGILFDSSENMKASCEWTVSTSGKWKGTILQNGKKNKVSGMVVFDGNGAMSLDSSAFKIEKISGTQVWTAKWNGLVLYGKKTEKIGSGWAGAWMGGTFYGEAAGGYAKIKISKSGKMSFSGKIFGQMKIGGNGSLLVLDRAFVEEFLPSFAGGEKIAFSYAWKKRSGSVFDGGFVFSEDGTLGGSFVYSGSQYDVLGSRWDKPSLTALDNTRITFSEVDDGERMLSIDVEAKSSSKIALETCCGFVPTKTKLSASKSTGVFKGTFNVDDKAVKFEGGLFIVGGRMIGCGGAAAKNGEFYSVEIGE